MKYMTFIWGVWVTITLLFLLVNSASANDLYFQRNYAAEEIQQELQRQRELNEHNRWTDDISESAQPIQPYVPQYEVQPAPWVPVIVH